MRQKGFVTEVVTEVLLQIAAHILRSRVAVDTLKPQDIVFVIAV